MAKKELPKIDVEILKYLKENINLVKDVGGRYGTGLCGVASHLYGDYGKSYEEILIERILSLFLDDTQRPKHEIVAANKISLKQPKWFE